MNNETSTPRRRFLKQASLLVAGAQAGVLLPFASAAPSAAAAGQARSSSAAAGSDLVVDTLSGKVRGTVQDGIRAFTGIPYGASPARKNRFMPPKKPMPWSGARAATAFGHDAPRAPVGGQYDFVRLIDWLTFPGGLAEDCLALNVWTPGVEDNAKRPVLVSFHGGGFISGTGSNILYNGHPLAKFGDVVVVTLNHRLGCLGYLNMADIGAPPEFAQAGATGMMDCVLALEWVRDNIANFGGDPSNVMIFGQSGGGSKVTHLLAMPSARGLFHRAAIQSSAAPLRAATREAATSAAERLLAQIGLTKRRVTELQQVPAEMMISAQSSLLEQNVPVGVGPVLNGSVIPRHPFDPDAPAISADVPVIISTTLNDASDGRTDFDLDEAGLRNPAPTCCSARCSRIEEDAATRTFLRIGRWRCIAPVHTCTFWCSPSPAYGGKFGPVHATDVPLVFHNIEGQQLTGPGPEARRMADQMAAAWVAFAKTGNPNHAGIPDWPAYTTDKRQTMIFNQTSRLEDDPWSELRAMWSED